jgi:hypothetical protein
VVDGASEYLTSDRNAAEMSAAWTMFRPWFALGPFGCSQHPDGPQVRHTLSGAAIFVLALFPTQGKHQVEECPTEASRPAPDWKGPTSRRPPTATVAGRHRCLDRGAGTAEANSRRGIASVRGQGAQSQALMPRHFIT